MNHAIRDPPVDSVVSALARYVARRRPLRLGINVQYSGRDIPKDTNHRGPPCCSLHFELRKPRIRKRNYEPAKHGRLVEDYHDGPIRRGRSMAPLFSMRIHGTNLHLGSVKSVPIEHVLRIDAGGGSSATEKL